MASNRPWMGALVQGTILIGWALVVVVICLVPTDMQAPAGVQLCVFCGDGGAADFVLNILFFVPLGVVLWSRGHSLVGVVALGALLSFGIETIQFWVPGRFTTLGDVVANALGAALGWWTSGRIAAETAVPPASSTGLSYVWSLGATIVLVVTGISSQASIPEGDLYANWIPRLEPGRFNRGAILDVTIGGLPLPSRRLDQPAAVRTLMDERAPLDIRFELGEARRYTLFRLIARRQQEIVRIDVDGADLLASPRYRAEDLLLARPWLRFRGALSSYSEGDTLAISLRSIEGGGHEVRAGLRTDTLGLDPSMGWMFLRPIWTRSPLLQQTGAAVWCALLFLPIGFFSRSVGGTIMAAIPPILALVLVPTVTPLLAAPAAAWIASLGALTAGYVVRVKRKRP